MKKNSALLVIISLTTILLTIPRVQSMTFEWSEPIQLTFDAGQDYGASIIQDSSGKIWVIYAKDTPSTFGDIWYQTSTDEGVNWSAEAILISDTLQEAPRTNLFQDSTGRLWVVWTSGRYSPRIHWDIYYTTSEDGGANWSPRENLTESSDDDGSPSLIEISGEVWIIFNKQPSSNKIWYYKFAVDSLEQTGPYEIPTEDSARVVTPCAMVDSTGKIWLVWTQHKDVHYKTSIENGASWSSDNHVISTANTETLPYIVEDNHGNVTVFYNIYDGGNPDDIGYRTSGDGGINWSNQKMAVSDDHTNTSPYAAFFENRIWVLWSSGRSGNIDLWLTKTEPMQLSAAVVCMDAIYSFEDLEETLTLIDPGAYSDILNQYLEPALSWIVEDNYLYIDDQDSVKKGETVFDMLKEAVDKIQNNFVDAGTLDPDTETKVITIQEEIVNVANLLAEILLTDLDEAGLTDLDVIYEFEVGQQFFNEAPDQATYGDQIIMFKDAWKQGVKSLDLAWEITSGIAKPP